MTAYCSERDIKFLLYEVLHIEDVTKYDYFKDSDGREVVDMTIQAAFDLGDNLYQPIFEEMDRKPPYIEGGQLIVHEKVRDIMRECGEGGWIGAGIPIEYDGFQMPAMLHLACRFILSAANYSAGVFPNLTAGAARLIVNFGTDYQKENYLPKMLEGQWQGTMAMTEPHAGSFLGDITTVAELDESGEFYHLSGQKIFISAGDHNCVGNVVHLLLGRVKGAPAGVKGLSLFMVPKLRIGDNDKLESNDVVLAEIFHKLGYKGCPITKLNFGDNKDCRAYLVGEENKGLSHMFQMMNEARISVGIGAAGIASAAYHAALEYTRERTQGRPLDSKDPSSAAVAIIEHPDVKRMLLYQKSIVEGALCLLLKGAKYNDLEGVVTGEEKERLQALLGLLVPIFKGYPSEKGVLCCSTALQCFGGYGFCDDFPVEQLYRDVRIHPLHEGTTGIQAIDLLGRKVRFNDGAAYKILLEEMNKAIEEAKSHNGLVDYAEKLSQAMDKLSEVTDYLMKKSKESEKQVWLGDATLYLEMFGNVVIAWQWLLQGPAIIAGLKAKKDMKEKNFYAGKLAALQYFFEYELNAIYALSMRLLKSDGFISQVQGDQL